MPRISFFHGIAITMYYSDHAPPHFHALYGGFDVQIRIDSLEPLRGRLPARQLGLVRAWALMHPRNWI